MAKEFINVGTVVHYVIGADDDVSCAAAVVLQAMKHDDGHFDYCVRVLHPGATLERDMVLHDEDDHAAGTIHLCSQGMVEEKQTHRNLMLVPEQP